MIIKLLEKFENWLIKRGSYTKLYLGGNLYFDRFYIFRSEKFAILLHKFYTHDQFLHCHPWWNFSFVLAGGYDEERFDGTIRTYKPGSFTFRQAEVFHRISRINEPGYTWSLFITGPRRRLWGQVRNGKWNAVLERLDEGLVGHVFPRRKADTNSTTIARKD